jgi:DNA mismatch endonuclease Vsr
MSRVKNKGSAIEQHLLAALRRAGLRPQSTPRLFGCPDFAFRRLKVAIFCDSHFWHGYRWSTAKWEIRSNRAFWITKIEKNMRRDREVNRALRKEGWIVLRFWEHQILKSTSECLSAIRDALALQRRAKALKSKSATALV